MSCCNRSKRAGITGIVHLTSLGFSGKSFVLHRSVLEFECYHQQVEVFFDSACPLCHREISFLRWMDRKNQVLFTDIAAADFQPQNYGKTMEELMAEIHGRLPDGSWVLGVEVFRRIYSAIGFRWLVWPTRAPGIRHALDWSYKIFAANRLRWTGRCDENCEWKSNSQSKDSQSLLNAKE